MHMPRVQLGGGITVDTVTHTQFDLESFDLTGIEKIEIRQQHTAEHCVRVKCIQNGIEVERGVDLRRAPQATGLLRRSTGLRLAVMQGFRLTQSPPHNLNPTLIPMSDQTRCPPSEPQTQTPIGFRFDHRRLSVNRRRFNESCHK